MLPLQRNYHLIWNSSPAVMLYTLLLFSKELLLCEIILPYVFVFFLWEYKFLEAGDFVFITEFPVSKLVPGTIVDTQ